MISTLNAHQASCQYSPEVLMTATLSTPTTVILKIQWEKLPADFILPDDPVENIYQPIQAAALREILDLAGLVTPDMLIGSNLGICATVNNKIVVKAPDWFYIPSVFPVEPGVTKGISYNRRLIANKQQMKIMSCCLIHLDDQL